MAMVVSFAIKSWIEGGVVAAVIGLNIVIGFMQEFKAEKTMDSLKSLSSPTANAVRDGKTVNVPTVEIVPGDMVEIKTGESRRTAIKFTTANNTLGDTVPADVRLIEAVNFETDEALLTGESLPVRKDADAVFDEDTGPGDRLNVAYSSSVVTKGRARGIVYATGMFTEIGSIAAALRKKDSKVRPVKRKPDGSARPHRYAQAWTLTFPMLSVVSSASTLAHLCRSNFRDLQSCSSLLLLFVPSSLKPPTASAASRKSSSTLLPPVSV